MQHSKRKKCGNSRALITALLMFLASAFVSAATPPNTEIINTANAFFESFEPVQIEASAQFIIADNSPAEIQFLQLAGLDILPEDTVQAVFPGAFCAANSSLEGPFMPIDLVAGGVPLTPGTNMSVITDPAAFASGEIVFIQVTDFDQNLDANVAETLSVEITTNPTGDREVLQLTETGLSTGKFVGGVQTQQGPGNSGNCLLDVNSDDVISVTYVDPENVIDTVSSVALVDPFGVVFSSLTGLPVNGTEISIIDADTGLPAEVFSPNGIDRWPSTVISGEDVTDSSGAVFPMGEGEYAFPRVVTGNYRFIITPAPGFLFPTVETDEQLQQLPNAPFVLAAGSRGEIFEVPPGPDVQIDIPLDPIEGNLLLQKSASDSSAAIGDFVRYEITAQNLESGQLSGVQIEDVLPQGFRLQPESVRFDEQATTDFTIDDTGRRLVFDIGDLAANQTLSIRYVVEISSGAEVGDATNTAVSISRLADSNVAQATVFVTNELFGDVAFIAGRVYEGSCGEHESKYGVPGAKIYLETGESVTTDFDGYWRIEGIEPGTHVLRLDTYSIDSSYEVLPCNENSRNFRSPTSAFIDLEPGTLWNKDFVLKRSQDAQVDEDPFAALILDRDFEDLEQKPEFDESYLGSAGLEVLWPPENYTPRFRTLEVAIKHDNNEPMSLYLNGDPVSALNQRESIGSFIFPRKISNWAGLDLREGANELKVKYENSKGESVSIVRSIYYSGPPYRAEFVPEASRLIADGRNPAIVAVRLTDADGYPVRGGTTGLFTVESPYQGWVPEQQRLESAILDTAENDPRFVVREDGIAYFPIEATTQTGRLQLRVPLDEGRFEIIEAWLSAESRDWVLVGLAENVWNYEKIESNLLPLGEEDRELVSEERIAFFGKGRIPGDFLLTLAYDSDKDASSNPDELFEGFQPDEFYSIYGDESQFTNEAQSSRKLFIRIERKQFYLLFGDFETDLTLTELSNYTRSLTGLKSEFKNNHFESNVFASETALANVRDEIPGNGTSGPYFLSRNNIVDFSEDLRVEVRDRFQTGRILSDTQLVRNIDYEIDYLLGEVNFKDPIATRDEFQNPIFIIANFETQDDRESALVAGGRIEVSDARDRVEFGLSHIREENRGQEAELTGLDLTYEPGDNTEVRAEVATSDTVAVQGADAWSVEATHENGAVTATAFARQLDGGFGVGQQNASESGTRKYGVQLRWDVGDKFELLSSFDDQEALDTGTQNRQANAEFRYIGQRLAANLGYRWAETDGLDGSASSQLANLGASVQLSRAIRLDASTEFPLNSRNDSPLFPTRYVVGAEWRINSDSSIFVSHERTTGGTEANATRLGVRTSLWTGSEVSLGIDQNQRDGGNVLSAVAGLTQRAQVNDRLTFDINLDQGRDFSSANPTSGLNPATPPTSGAGGNSFTAVSVGSDLRGANYTWSNRVEYRTADLDDQLSLSSGFLRPIGQGKSLIASVDYLDRSALTSAEESYVLSLGYANRGNDRFTLLNRVDLRWEETESSSLSVRDRKLVTNNHFNFRLLDNNQLSLLYGAKYVLTDFGSQEFSGLTNLLSAQYRYDIGSRWDLGAQASLLSSQNSSNRDYSYGLSVGFSPVRDLWLELGYNFAGFSDDDFDNADRTQEGPVLSFRYKFDETTGSRIGRAFKRNKKDGASGSKAELSSEEKVRQIERSLDSEYKTLTDAKPQGAAQPEIAANTEPQSKNKSETDSKKKSFKRVGQIENGFFDCPAPPIGVRVIQFASFSEEASARRLLAEYNIEHSFIERYQRSANDRAVYRLVAGPYTASKEALKSKATAIDAITGSQSWIKDKSCADLRRID